MRGSGIPSNWRDPPAPTTSAPLVRHRSPRSTTTPYSPRASRSRGRPRAVGRERRSGRRGLRDDRPALGIWGRRPHGGAQLQQGLADTEIKATPSLPPEIERLRQVDQVPWVLTAFLSLLATLALTHTRHRRTAAHGVPRRPQGHRVHAGTGCANGRLAGDLPHRCRAGGRRPARCGRRTPGLAARGRRPGRGGRRSGPGDPSAPGGIAALLVSAGDRGPSTPGWPASRRPGIAGRVDAGRARCGRGPRFAWAPRRAGSARRFSRPAGAIVPWQLVSRRGRAPATWRDI